MRRARRQEKAAARVKYSKIVASGLTKASETNSQFLVAAGCNARRARRQEKAAAQREGPWTGAVQNESQLQEDTSKLAVGSAEGQVKSRFGAFAVQNESQLQEDTG